MFAEFAASDPGCGRRSLELATGPCRILATAGTASGLRDHEHDGRDGKRDAADGEQPDGAEPQRYVATLTCTTHRLTGAPGAYDSGAMKARERVGGALAAWRPRMIWQALPGHSARPRRA